MRKFTYYGSFASVVSDYFTNLFGVPDAAYSLRKLSPNSVYSGAAIRVRRSSDNTEQDIGFISSAANAAINTTALLAFVGSGNGFVTVWYNQGGAAGNLTQTTAANQPRIVNAGALEVIGSDVAINFTGIPHFNNSAIRGNSRVDYYGVVQNIATIRLKMYSVRASASGYSYVSQSGSTVTVILNQAGTPSLYIDKGLFGGTNRGQVQAFTDGYHAEVYQALNLSSWANFIFGGNFGAAGFNFGGKFQEAIFYFSDKSADRDNINDNQNDFYGIF